MSASAATHLPAAPRHGLDRVGATHLAVGASVPAAVFTFSRLVEGPTLADSGGGSTVPTTNSVPSAPPGVSPAEHEAHRR